MRGMVKRSRRGCVALLALAFLFTSGAAYPVENKLISSEDREAMRKDELKDLQQKFNWWPTDAKPGPVKDEVRGGYWWWPTTPGKVRPWGNRGFVYVYKIIFDYKADELPPPQEQELRACLLVRKILKNVKVYFDFDKAELRDDAIEILNAAVKTLDKNPRASILITGNCDVRGSENYNLDLGKRRAAAVNSFMLSKGVAEDRIRIISRGKLDAIAPVSDIVGMQKDRNAQFMVAEVEEVMMPYAGTGQPDVAEEGAQMVEEGKYVIEKSEDVTSQVKVSTKEYTIRPNDSLWKIAEREYGSGYRWKQLYEVNKDRIKNPNKLRAGTVIVIPIE